MAPRGLEGGTVEKTRGIRIARIARTSSSHEHHRARQSIDEHMNNQREIGDERAVPLMDQHLQQALRRNLVSTN
jgi:hypothetical protein